MVSAKKFKKIICVPLKDAGYEYEYNDEVYFRFNKANLCLYFSEELDKRVKFEIILISPQMLGKMQGAKAEVRQEINHKS